LYPNVSGVSSLPTSIYADLTPQAVIEHFDCRCDKPPTSLADLLVGTARSNLVIVRHVDVKDELSPLRLQRSSGERLTIPWLLLSPNMKSVT
jgi:hypothetical protein